MLQNRVRTAAAAQLIALLACGAASAQPSAGDGWTVPSGQAPAPISRQEHAQRRARLAADMGAGVLVVLGNDEPDADYLSFSQNSPFRYLTGVTEPGAALVIDKRGGTPRELLFVLPRDPSREVWEGARLGAEAAGTLTGMPARSREAMKATLDSMLAGGTTLYMVSPLSADGSRSDWQRPDQQFAAKLAAAHAGTKVQWLDRELFRIRAVKTPAELDLLRRSIHITLLAHREAMKAVEPGMNEFEIKALIEGTFRRYGADGASFGTITGSGPNATTLHYRAADRYMQPGETLVMDIGAWYRGYAADVTRTVPVSGRFSPEQRSVYEIVLAAQKAAEAQARPGASFAAMGQTAQRVIGEGLARLGLIESATATYDCAGRGGQIGKCPQTSLFYMHGLGHGIGLDVHDPDQAYFGAFQVGSAFTIEPGIYVRADVLDYLPDTPGNRALRTRLAPVVARYRNIGVRIEDDYFITSTGVERVTEGAPREIAEIEALMARPSEWNRTRRPEVVEWYRGTTPRGPVASVPFTLAPEQNQLVSGSESHIVKTQVVGVVTLDDDELRVQFRVLEHSWRYRGGRVEEGTTESEVRELAIPLRSLRSVRVAGFTWWPRLEIAVADMRALEGFPRAATGEVSLRIRRRDRTDARELASQVEYVLAERLLSLPEAR